MSDEPLLRDDGPVALPPCPVADTMLRVQAMLRAGAPPTYEALLAYGEPRFGRRSG